MGRQIIMQGGKPAFVVIPIEEWNRIETMLENRLDIAAVRSYLSNPTETFPDSVAAALVKGVHPLKALRQHRGVTQSRLASAAGTSAVYLSQIERGARPDGRKLRDKLAKVLHIEPDLLARE